MFKRPDEDYHHYKKRVMDPISSTFCGAKWYNATIWLGQGATTSCHHPPSQTVPEDLVKANPKALHNTPHKKMMRKMMLQGKRPGECEYCWKIEDSSGDNISDRVFKTVVYEEKDLIEAATAPVETDVNLKSLEIAFERTCNFACSYCNSTFSSRWGQEIAQNGIYENLSTPGSGAYKNDGKWAEPYKKTSENPYVEAFWKWWPELAESLQELRITGGEPLMSEEIWKFFDFFKQHGSGKLSFGVNTNLGAKDELIDRLIEGSYYVNEFHLYTSCESVGAHAEYIRDGMNYERFLANLRKICTDSNVQSVNVMMTVNSLSLFSLPEFLDTLVEFKAEFGWFFPVFTVNILRFPNFMSLLYLPDEIREERQQALSQWMRLNQDSPLIHEIEKQGILRLIDYLKVVQAPHPRHSIEFGKMNRDFKSFYTQYDQRRGKDIRKVFPKSFVDWYDSISLTEKESPLSTLRF